MPKTAGWYVVMVMCLAAGVWGCNQTSTSGDDDDRVACSDDTDCRSYYRCLDGRCDEPPAMTGHRQDETPVAEFFDNDQLLASFYLELAVTSQEQAQGLMYRPEMLPDWGMLFVYDDEGYRSFWMKNTLIELDMIFIDASGEVVGVVHRAEPETETSRSVGEPSRYVLEIKGGLAEEHGIESGVKMRLENVENDHRPDP